MKKAGWRICLANDQNKFHEAWDMVSGKDTLAKCSRKQNEANNIRINYEFDNTK